MAVVFEVIFYVFLGLLAEVYVCPGNAAATVEVHLDTILEVNGVSGVPPVFGLTAYGGAGDFATDGGIEFLKQYCVDTIGLGEILGKILPQAPNITLNVSELVNWLSSGSAQKQYEKSGEYNVLTSKGIRKGGAKPFIFLKTADGSCTPDCEEAECYPNAGTPKARNASSPEEMFLWWSTLFAGYFNFCMMADPQLDTVHIWNEPNAHFWKDGKNGTYYATFYAAIVHKLKSLWPHVKFGGPVTWDPPTGPFGPPSMRNRFVNWDDYTKPLIDTALPDSLLDFMDFHAYNEDANPGSLRNAIQAVGAYAQVKYNRTLPVAITESNYKLQSSEERNAHFYNRTFPLLLSTLALFQHPDRVLSRQIFDYKSNGSNCSCGFVSGSSKDLHITPDAELYRLLGKFSNGTLLLVDVQDDSQPCECYDTMALGGTHILAKSARVGNNITVALANPCNCTQNVHLRFENGSVAKLLSVWAATLDVHSLREVMAPAWPEDTVALTPLSLLLATYELADNHQPSSSNPKGEPAAPNQLLTPLGRNDNPNILWYNSYIMRRHWQSNNRLYGKTMADQSVKAHVGAVAPNKIRRMTTVFPKDSTWIMKQIPVEIPCNYTLSIDFDIQQILYQEPVQVDLQFGILGEPGTEVWKVHFTCSNYLLQEAGKKLQEDHSESVNIVSPGPFFELKLPCIPSMSPEGLATFHFETVTCGAFKRRHLGNEYQNHLQQKRELLAYYSFALLDFESQS